MQKFFAWAGTSLVAGVSFVFSAFPILNTTPRFVAIGVLLVSIGVLLCLPIGQGGSALSRVTKSSSRQQTVTASGGAQVVAAGRDITSDGSINVNGPKK